MSEAAPLRILIVDDEAPARRRLREILGDCSESLPLNVIGEAENGRQALELLGSASADLMLADIHMPDMSGLELARHALKLPQPPAVVFTTAHSEHALEAFEVNAIDYLTKPVKAQRLLSALQRTPRRRPLPEATLDRLSDVARRFLSVTERTRVILVPVDEVVYLKAELKYVTVRTAAREYLIEESLTRLEREFGERLVRVHRNCLVARACVRGFERCTGPEGETRWEVVLHGINEKLPVSRRQQHVVREFGGRAAN